MLQPWETLTWCDQIETPLMPIERVQLVPQRPALEGNMGCSGPVGAPPLGVQNSVSVGK